MANKHRFDKRINHSSLQLYRETILAMQGWFRPTIGLGFSLLLCIQMSTNSIRCRFFDCRDVIGDKSINPVANDRRYLLSEVPVNVSVGIVLSYLNEAVANLLKPQSVPSNNVSAHLCWAVGMQVCRNNLRCKMFRFKAHFC